MLDECPGPRHGRAKMLWVSTGKPREKKIVHYDTANVVITKTLGVTHMTLGSLLLPVIEKLK